MQIGLVHVDCFQFYLGLQSQLSQDDMVNISLIAIGFSFH